MLCRACVLHFKVCVFTTLLLVPICKCIMSWLCTTIHITSTTSTASTAYWVKNSPQKSAIQRITSHLLHCLFQRLKVKFMGFLKFKRQSISSGDVIMHFFSLFTHCVVPGKITLAVTYYLPAKTCSTCSFKWIIGTKVTGINVVQL